MEVYGRYPRFQYGDFWFGFMDPWPEYWPANWYDNDDVYIVYATTDIICTTASIPEIESQSAFA
jgi:hypothetical protein